MIYIDVNGTIIGNAHLCQDDCVRAVLDLRARFENVVQLVSGRPGMVDVLGLEAFDRMQVIRELNVGDIWVDNDRPTLLAALHMGAIAVPAKALCDLADLMCPGRDPQCNRAALARVEHAYWSQLCLDLRVCGAVTQADLETPVGVCETPGQILLTAIREWGKLRSGLEVG